MLPASLSELKVRLTKLLL